ncbi:bacteriophage abortive infection AbiH family protein [uncultured Pedobacter sp.]|uniref:bacteriophage abortive infection AbiH family protein n=1 Tax=uncultured Pedobacter sp. TaxID=246139 RepID=UPI0025FD8AFD|nr:bacteriophage abortive infection AbiH family protein [uncultured Pedobacter sp.]
MPTLYIIGNRFDLHNGLKTSYADFHRYITKNNKELESQIDQYFEMSTNADYLWKDFENDLSTFDTEGFYETYDFTDVMSDSFKISETYGLQDEIQQETERLTDSIKEGFTDWVEEIEFPEKEVCNVFHEEDAFITFNYTNTLELLCGIQTESILYIHGSVEGHDELIFGHGEEIETEDDELDEDGNSTRTMFTDARNASQYPLHALFKDTVKILKTHAPFINGLSGINKICVLGHSLGKADWPYFKKLSEVFPDASWKISYYSEWERENLAEVALKITSIPEDRLKMIRIDEL